jgi:hypothetical protein
MRDVRELHRLAMDSADRAADARRSGDDAAFLRHTRDALDKESEAAALVSAQLDLEPTRSVLHRSAASLALECGEMRRAEQLISTALSGNPPEEVAEELRDLLEDVYFRRHLEVRGVSLDPGEFQMSLEGSAVGFGIARSADFVGRVKDLETLISRTAERRLGRPFREAGRRQKALSEGLELYVSVPRAASLAVTFRLGSTGQFNLPGIDLARDVVDDLMDCIELLDKGDVDELKAKIQDEAYFRNFVGLAKKIAPDGEKIRTVGFTTTSPHGDREVALSKPRAKADDAVHPPESSLTTVGAQQFQIIRGKLLEADARNERAGKIQVVSADGKRHSIRVPRGMMSDIVKPSFEEQVIVQARAKGKQLLLESIDLAEDDDSALQ